MSGDLRVCEDLDSLSAAVAKVVAELCRQAVRDSGRFDLALSGGATPRALYRELAKQYRSGLPWQRIHLFWGDERYLPLADARSNFRMADDALIRRLPVPPANVHPMPTHLDDIRQAAQTYEEILRAHFHQPWPHFYLLLLGLGEDCHTASLFPDSPALTEQRRWVIPSVAPEPPQARLTLTVPALCHAANTFFLVSGAGKSSALRKVLAAAQPSLHCPASLIRPVNGQLIWWADRAATALLPASVRPPR